MSFLSNLVSEFTSSAPGGLSQNGPSDPPPVPRPWYAEWSSRDERWVFINEQTGERTFDRPSDNNNYGNDGYGYSEGAANWAGRKVGEVEEVGDDVRYGYDDAKYRAENRVDNAVQDVEDVPGDVRRGYDRFENRVEGDVDRFGQRVEDIPQDVAYGAGEAYGKVQDFGQEVENIPNNIAQGFDRFGERIEQGFDDVTGDARRFGDEQQDAFDAGRQEGRRDDW